MTSPALIERFMHLCSHELRGPVCTIQGLVKLASEHPQTVDVSDCLRLIGEYTQKMNLIIHSLQDFIEIESTLSQVVDRSKAYGGPVETAIKDCILLPHHEGRAKPI